MSANLTSANLTSPTSTKTTLGNILESDVITNVIQFLGFKETARRFCLLNKLARKRYIAAYSTTKPNTTPTAKLIEKEGRKVCIILDVLRYAVVDLQLAELSPQAKRVVRGINDLQTIRGMGMMEDLAKLNVYSYSYWHRGTGSVGAFQYLKDCLKVNKHMNVNVEVERDVQYWKDSRVFGDFFLLFDREDGSILVSSDFQKVYLVLGHADTLCECMRTPRRNLKTVAAFHEPLAGVRVSTSLLNWDNQIVYDGLMMHKGPLQKDLLKRALKAYVKALDKGTLITALDRQLVGGTEAASSSSKPKKTGAVTAKPLPPTPPTTIPLEHSDTVKRILARLMAAPSATVGYDSGDGRSNKMWVFRRHGYTERENPQHLVTVMQGGMPLIPFHKYSALVPSMFEMLTLIDMSVTAAKGKPGCIAIDVEYGIEALNTLLQGANIYIMYYPPPSEEEVAYSSSTNPYLTRNERLYHTNGPSCAVCHSEVSENGEVLMKCARCRSEHYCSKEHQKLHWKKHKHVCVPV